MTAPLSAAHLKDGTFEGRTVFVTGGGTGLGLEISRGFAHLGARVAIASRDPAHHEPLLAEAAEHGLDVRAYELDVREANEVDRLAERVEDELGPVDTLVNNAAGNFLCPAERLSHRAWRAVLGIVLDGTFYCSRAFGRRMIGRGEGQILNVVATYAWTGMPGVVHSASAKAGVLAMTRTLAVEWADRGVRVNAIAPGPFETEGAAARLWPDEAMRARMEATIPLKRLATVDEVAGHCLYLLSPASTYVNGECLVVDGGLSLGRNWMVPPGAEPRRRQSSSPR